MLWRATPAGWVKGIWWDVKEARKRLKKGIVPKEAVRKANPIVLRPAAYTVWASLTWLKASPRGPRRWPGPPPTTPARGAYEGGARAPMNRPSGGEEVREVGRDL
jgi:putative transposase